jgi:PPOX class probable F420-dependent enzyme
MEKTNIIPLQYQTFINIETIRKNNLPVRTPVWFVMEDGLIFVRTGTQSGKVKRMRNNPAVNIAACKSNGDLIGEWIEGQAEIISNPIEEQVINRKFNRKYGLQKKLYDLFGFFNRMKMTAIVIRI